MKVTNSKWLIALGVLASVLSACGASGTPTPARGAATQTPWIIERIITATPEPAVATPLPTVGAPPATEARVASRTPTRAVVAVRPTATKTAPPVAVAPSPTAAPKCSLGMVKLTFPENGARRDFKVGGTGGPAFLLTWIPPDELGGSNFAPNDPAVGYKVELVAKKRGSAQVVNATVIYISHNKYIEQRRLEFDPRSARALVNEDDASVVWQVTIIKVAGFDGQGGKSGTEIICGAPSMPFTIDVVFQGG